MKMRLNWVLIFVAVAPVMLMAWLGVWTARVDREQVQSRLEDAAMQRLLERRTVVSEVLTKIRQEVLGVLGELEGETSTTSLREPGHKHPLVRQLFVMDKGDLVFPDRDSMLLNELERGFLERTASIWSSGETFCQTFDLSQQVRLNNQVLQIVASNDAQQQGRANNQILQQFATFNQTTQQSAVTNQVLQLDTYSQSGQQGTAMSQQQQNMSSIQRQNTTTAEPRSGWYTWFWDNGLNFIVWHRALDGVVSGVEIERAAVMAAVINALPSNDFPVKIRSFSGGERTTFRTTLVNAQGELIYQWGLFDDNEGQEPLVTLPLTEPLAAWRLEYYMPPLRSGFLSPVMLSIILTIIAVSIAVGVGVVYIHREQTRLSREASERVTFVNQVSHELKTPLTNIQMYAELLQKRMDGSDDRSDHYLEVVTAESQRLGRMINNVLAFARQQRGKLKLQYTLNDLDAVVASVVDYFAPSLENQGISVKLEKTCGCEAMFDRDVLEQILGNLLSNVEKYAGDGSSVKIRTACDQQQVEIFVQDDGPGIPVARQADIFEPFVRLDDRLTEGVSGTGIGLSIARELACLHGGNLTLEPSEKGACFKVQLEVRGAALLRKV